MTDYKNENRGSIWKNEKKETDNHPDFTGQLDVEGVQYWVSAWKRKPDANPKSPALSFSVKRKEEARSQPQRQAAQPEPDDFPDDDIPF